MIPQNDPWNQDRTASVVALLLPLPVLFFVFGPWPALACLVMLLLGLLWGPYEPISAAVLLFLIPVGFYFLRPLPEALAVAGYLLFLILIGSFWLLRNLRADKKRKQRAQIKE